MHVRLQGNKVTAESDGSLSFQPDPARPCMYPIFSIEVSLRLLQSADSPEQTKETCAN